MFKTMFRFLLSGFSMIKFGFEYIYFMIKKFWILSIATILTFVGFIKSLVVLIGDLITESISLMTSFIVSVPADHTEISEQILEVFKIANTFYPLEETFIYISALSLLWIACLTYRVIKSWIPVVGN